jgi:hypothetical protein
VMCYLKVLLQLNSNNISHKEKISCFLLTAVFFDKFVECNLILAYHNGLINLWLLTLSSPLQQLLTFVMRFSQPFKFIDLFSKVFHLLSAFFNN